MDYLKRNEQLEHVRQQLAMYGGLSRPASADSTFVLCPYHSERTPSFRIFHGASTRIPGYGSCYGCGQKGAWNTFADLLGLQPFQQGKPQERYVLPRLATVDDGEPVDDAYYTTALPKGKMWRGIPTNLLRKAGCKMYHSEKYGTRYVFMPVLVNKEMKGFIRARLRKEKGKPSYLNSRTQWAREYGLFPFDYTMKFMRKKKTRTVLLVEGQRDALRLLNHGIPALCVMGTQSWSDHKARLLELHGVDHAVLMLDGDDAGREATAIAKDYLKPYVKVSAIKLWAIKGSPYRKHRHLEPEERKQYSSTFWDPGNCPEWVLDRVKELYFNE